MKNSELFCGWCKDLADNCYCAKPLPLKEPENELRETGGPGAIFGVLIIAFILVFTAIQVAHFINDMLGVFNVQK